MKITFVNFGKVVLFHYEGLEIEKRKQMVLTLPGFGRVLEIHDNLLRREDQDDDDDDDDGGTLILQPGWRERQREPVAKRIDHPPRVLSSERRQKTPHLGKRMKEEISVRHSICS